MSKNIMRALNQRPIAYYPIYAEITGSIHGGILLSQLMYWFSKKDKIYKVASELMEELQFTERQLRTAKGALKQVSFVKTTLEGIPAKTYYSIDWDEYNSVLACWDETVLTGQDETVLTVQDETVQTITETTTETTTEKKNKQKSPEGFLSPDQIPAPVNKSNTRKQTQEQPNLSPTPSRKKKRKYDPHCEATIGHAKQVYHFTCIEDRIEAVIDAYRTLKPDDQTRSRGRANIRKLLETGNHTTHSLLLAVERHAAMVQPCWGRQIHSYIDYENKSAWTEPQFIHGVGNFFGREALYRQYCKPGYRADIEEVDWAFFRQEFSYYWDGFKPGKYTWDFLWAHNVTINQIRRVQRYGYTPAQLAGSYDRRFQ